ncbi:MAG: GNAT family N-acetyltransferase [Acidimicrobiales bacterium]
MSVRVLRTLSEVDEVTESWAALADASASRHYVQPYWALSWWKHLGNGELHVAVAESKGQLLALAPLYRSRRLGVDTLRFLGSDMLGVSEVLVAAGEEQAGRELWTNLLDEPRTMLDLHQYRLAGPGIDALRHVGDRAWRAELGPAGPFVTIDGSWDDYWQSRRRSFRRELDRMDRLAEREGMPYRIEVAFDRDDVDKRLPDVTEVFDIAERARPRTHFFAGAYRPFTVDILHRAAELSRLALFVLYLGDRPVATSFTFRSNNLISGGGLRFDPSFSRFTPGQVLFRHVLGHAFSSGCTEFDFGPRDAPYKREWSTGAYDTLEVSAFSSPSVRALHLAKSALKSSGVVDRLSSSGLLRRS